MELGRKFLPPLSGSPGPKVCNIWMPFPFVVLIDQRQIPSSCFTFLEKPRVSIMQIYFPPPNFYQTTTVLFPEEQLSSLSFSDNSLLCCLFVSHIIFRETISDYFSPAQTMGEEEALVDSGRGDYSLFSHASVSPPDCLFVRERSWENASCSVACAQQCKEGINYSVPFSPSPFSSSSCPNRSWVRGSHVRERRKRNGFSGFRRKEGFSGTFLAQKQGISLKKPTNLELTI